MSCRDRQRRGRLGADKCGDSGLGPRVLSRDSWEAQVMETSAIAPPADASCIEAGTGFVAEAAAGFGDAETGGCIAARSAALSRARCRRYRCGKKRKAPARTVMTDVPRRV